MTDEGQRGKKRTIINLINLQELSEEQKEAFKKAFAEAQESAREKYPGIFRQKKEEPKIDFLCREPKCGSKEYEEVYVPIVRMVGGKGKGFTFYACANCSVMFRDPKKFSCKI